MLLTNKARIQKRILVEILADGQSIPEPAVRKSTWYCWQRIYAWGMASDDIVEICCWSLLLLQEGLAKDYILDHLSPIKVLFDVQQASASLMVALLGAAPFGSRKVMAALENVRAL